MEPVVLPKHNGLVWPISTSVKIKKYKITIESEIKESITYQNHSGPNWLNFIWVITTIIKGAIKLDIMELAFLPNQSGLISQF